MALFRFLHVSDLHIGATAAQLGLLPFAKSGFALQGYTGLASVSSHREDILEGLALLAHREGSQLDGVIITGDLATTGGQADVQAAHDFVHTPPSSAVPYKTLSGRPTLHNPENVNVYLIPGNHDRYDGAAMLPGGKEFDKLFGAGGTKEWPAGQSAHLIDVLKDGGVSLALIGGDFSLRSAAHVTNPAHVLGAGRAYAHVIREMENLTDQVRGRHKQVEVVWLTHFPPRFPSAPALLPLLNEGRLVRAAFGKKINYLLAGHTHAEDRYVILNPQHLLYGGHAVDVLCGGTATEHRLPHSTDPRTAHLLEFNVWADGSCTASKRTLSWDDNLSYWV